MTEDRFHVVVNHEEQHSIWPVHLDVPDGWTVRGEAATRAECLDRIERDWPDITPKSLRAKEVSGHG